MGFHHPRMRSRPCRSPNLLLLQERSRNKTKIQVCFKDCGREGGEEEAEWWAFLREIDAAQYRAKRI